MCRPMQPSAEAHLASREEEKEILPNMSLKDDGTWRPDVQGSFRASVISANLHGVSLNSDVRTNNDHLAYQVLYSSASSLETCS